MPLPKPKSDEDKKTFVSRCVSELHDKEEFTDNKQRLAVCFSQFERANESVQIEAYGPKWDKKRKERPNKYRIVGIDKNGKETDEGVAKTITTARNKAKMYIERFEEVFIIDAKTGKKLESFKGGFRKGRIEVDSHDFLESFTEHELDEATFKRVNRIRGGKIQKRKKVAGKKGYKVQDGKVVRMKSSEKLARKKAAKKAARKRKGKKSQIARSTKKSMRLRKARGL